MDTEDEINWALMAQKIDLLKPSLLLKAVEVCGSFQSLFNPRGSLAQSEIAPLLNRLAGQYQSKRCQLQAYCDQVHSRVNDAGASIIPITSSEYPPLLREISTPPALIYLRGDGNVLHLPQLAIVGSRRMSRGGEQSARQWSSYLAASGFVITSGLATGIDGVAHRAAIEAANGKTVAVMATGIDQVYPGRHRRLADQIVANGGALVTEFCPQTQPLPGNFPRRNRIISGLSLGVLVIEAACKSGSLITARCALEQNREVFALPGSIHNPQARGCHQLIRDGAHLVERADEVAAELGAGLSRIAWHLPRPAPPEGEAGRLLQLLGYHPAGCDELCQSSGLPIQQINALLTELQMAGLVECRNGVYCRIS